MIIPPSFGTCDPGKHGGGFSLFRAGSLVAAIQLHTLRWPSGVVDDVAKQVTEACVLHGMFPLPWFVGEFPEIRHGSGVEHVVKTAADLLPLNFMLGVVAMASGAQHVEEVPPSRWKGNVDPDKLTLRIRDGDPEFGLKPKVTPAERAIIGKGDHNVVDSVGLGLWRVGRLHPGRR